MAFDGASVRRVLLPVCLLAAELSMAQPFLPAARSQGDIAYITGGIGQDEANAMRHAAKNYSLMVELVRHAVPKDQFETDAVVSIRREGGEIVLDTLVDGPFLLVNLPPGHYIVTAQKKSEPMHRTVKIDPKSSQRVIFEWKD
jgi:uncharacterized protein (UPF0248 family)